MKTIIERIFEAFEKPMIEYNMLDNIIVCGGLILLVFIIAAIVSFVMKGKGE